MNKGLLTTMMATCLTIATPSQAQDAPAFIGRQKPAIKERTFTPEALWAMGRIGGYEVAPDTKSVVYNVSYYSVEQNKSHSVIYTINTDGTEEKLLTTSKGSELAPKFIANGKLIAYLAVDDNGTMQIWTMNPDGTDRKQISKLVKDVDDFMFSPDESKVLVIHTVKSGKRASDIHPDLTKTTGRLLNDAMYRHWDEWVESVPQPFIYRFNGTELSTDPIRILSDEPYECPMKPFGGIEQLAWSPDSKQIAYTCRKKTGLDYAVSTDSDIFLYDIESGKTANLCKPVGYVAPKVDYTRSLQNQAVNAPIKEGKDYNLGYDTNPQFSPDGKFIAWQSMERDGYESDRNRLCVYEIATGTKTYVTELFQSGVDAFCWAENSKNLFFVGTWYGCTHVYATNLNGEIKKITDGQYDYTSVSLCGKNLLCGRQSMCEAKELYLVNPNLTPEGKKINIYKAKAPKKGSHFGGATSWDFEELSIKNDDVTKNVTQLTKENQYFRDNIDWGTVEAFITTTVDGKKMLSWIAFPPNYDPNKKYPTLLFCEGGPQSPVSQFWSYRWNFMVMASQGYIVVAPNRRGLPGFGMEWLEEISTNYGGHCMDDYKSAIDAAVKHYPSIDKDRLGCVGASFGGFSVYWLAGNHDKRFKCFIAHDGIFNLEQQYLETEEMWFANWDLGGAPWHQDDPVIKRTYDNSPHKFVNKWDAPILCIQGEKDYRIVTSQAMAAYNAALYRGIPAEFLVFPDENHWVLKPQNGMLWQRTFFRWLDRWLK